MEKIRQFLTELSARDTSIFSFPGDNFGKYRWIFTKLGVCIDIVETWFGIADGQISLSARGTSVLSYLDDNFSKCQWIFTKLGMCFLHCGDLLWYC